LTHRQEEENVQIFEPNDKFLRRIPPLYYNPTTKKISSAAFQNASGTNRMSVNWMNLSSVDDTLRGYPRFGIASISAELCWTLKQEIERTGSDSEPAHCDVIGNKPPNIRKQFRDNAEYLRYPQNS